MDGKPVSVAEGATILEATRQLRHRHADALLSGESHAVNVCRICVVELEGSRVLVPACSRRAEAGMVVKTDSARVRLSRRLVLEFLASSVDVSTAPTLLEYMRRYDARPERFGEPSPRTRPENAMPSRPDITMRPKDGVGRQGRAAGKVDNDLYVRDYSKCILCYKCVEACGTDAQNTFAIAVAGRGFGHVSRPNITSRYRLGLCLLRKLHWRLSHRGVDVPQ